MQAKYIKILKINKILTLKHVAMFYNVIIVQYYT